MTEEKRASRASKSRPGLLLSSRFGSATAKDISTSCGRKNRLKSWGFISLTIRRDVNQKVDNLNAKLGTWRSRQLSIFGCCLIVKSPGISQFVHSAAVVDIHKDYIVKIQSLIFTFIWKEKQDKIKREVLYQDHERGGLRVYTLKLCVRLYVWHGFKGF